MIGGNGEKKTLRLVAAYADESNLTSAVPEIGRKLEVLAGHCERLGRDRSEISVSQQLNVCIAETHDDAFADIGRFLGGRGLNVQTMSNDTLDRILALVIWGDPDEVGEQLAAILQRGVDGFTTALPANGHLPDRVELLGQVASKVLG